MERNFFLVVNRSSLLSGVTCLTNEIGYPIRQSYAVVEPAEEILADLRWAATMGRSSVTPMFMNRLDLRTGLITPSPLDGRRYERAQRKRI